MSEIIAFVIGFVIGVAIIISESVSKTEVIKHGAAHYTVDMYGSTKFVWNDEEAK